MIRLVSILGAVVLVFAAGMIAPAATEFATAAGDGRYACQTDLIEVIFSDQMQVRLRDDRPVDLKTNTPVGVDAALPKTGGHTWLRLCDLSEEQLDDIQARGVAKRGQPVFNLNNIYRLRIPEGLDIWETCRELEAVSGVASARPMPLPTPPPQLPPDYEPNQGYLDSAGSTPVGIDAHYAWTWPGGDGTGVTVCDIEYSWNYNHGDISKAYTSPINPTQIVDPFPADQANHGTAVIGILVADDNGWGTTGICHGATLKLCGSYFVIAGPPIDTIWDVPAAITYAINALTAGDVILLEQQWDYGDPTTPTSDYIPIEWWTDYYPSAQLHNGVYIAIENAIANGINVVEAGGNGGAPTPNTGYNTGLLTWYGNNDAIIVGAGGVYSGGLYTEGDLERVSWSSYGPRYDVQAWGEDVVTTGYGDLDSTMGYNYRFTNTFAGTSSASPIVAGAAACGVGYYKEQGMNITWLDPSTLRGLLNYYSTPQVVPPAGQIGPRPDLKGTFGWMRNDWVDVTAPPINLYGQRNTGVAWGDYNGDNYPDLYATNFTGNSNKLFANNGSGAFTDATVAPLNVADLGYGAAWGDYDNDGDLDLYLANNDGPNQLFRNDGGGAFTDVTAAPLNDLGYSLHVCWVDYNNDGRLDIYVTSYLSANRLYRNNGDGTFTDIAAGSPVGYNGSSGGAAWGDYDNDGDMDLYLTCNYGEANHLYRNDGNGTFVDVTVAPLGDTNEGYGVDWGDYDDDGDLDLYLANNGQANKLFRNDGGTFTDVTAAPLDDAGYGMSAGWADYNNDGNLDIYVVNSGTANRLFTGDGAGGFTAFTNSAVLDNAYGAGFGWGDYDLDGDLDIYLANAGLAQENRLFRNNIGDFGNWLAIDLVGTASNKSSVGARVRLVAGGKSQMREVTAGSGFCSQHTLTVEFGLGAVATIDSLIVRWPSGVSQKLTAVSINTRMQLVEPSTYVCGDANRDNKVNIGDAVYIISYIFRGGPAPNPIGAGNANCDGKLNVGDAVYIISYIFRGGPAPCCP
ncbi:MAG: FG-GAP-like repeat-containing protein [candidate division Zixibacteria bacterium]|nr:FG-GAP-like repeat-containing protein [candidate division Zixibacteria bacterium]